MPRKGSRKPTRETILRRRPTKAFHASYYHVFLACGGLVPVVKRGALFAVIVAFGASHVRVAAESAKILLRRIIGANGVADAAAAATRKLTMPRLTDWYRLMPAIINKLISIHLYHQEIGIMQIIAAGA